jgi:hypothetical protein
MKIPRIREKNPVAWYSNNVFQCALSVNKIACWDALQIHSHTHPSLYIFSPAPEEKTPRPSIKASNPSRRTAPSAPFESEFSFNLLLAFVCDLAFYPLFVFPSLDLLLEEILNA